MQPLRIIIVMVEPPLPFGNAAARWYYVLLKGLMERGHHVTAFATCSKASEIDEAQKLFPAPSYDLRCYSHPRRNGLGAKLETLRRPYSYMFSRQLRHDLETELVKGFDILHLEQLWAGWMGLSYPHCSLLNVHHLVSIDLQNQMPIGWNEKLIRRLTFRTEETLLRSYRHIRSCSPRLVPDIARFSPSADITTIPVGLDSSQYTYISDEKRGSVPVISVIGSMGWYPSLSAARRFLLRLWPKIKDQVPAAKAQVIGWDARRVLKEFIALDDVLIEENVPDIRPYFEGTSVFLYAPERGSGMKIKILEALAFGVPIVTTAEGVEGIPAVDGVHAGVSDDDKGLVDRTVALLNNTDLQNRQRAAGRTLLESYCGPQATVGQIETVYSKMLENHFA